MSACGSTDRVVFGGPTQCEREDGHPGQHQNSEDRWIWSSGGAHGMPRDGYDCPECGTHDVRSDLVKQRTEGDQCGTCDFWDAIAEQYRDGRTVVSDGRAYTWAPSQPWGFDGAKVLITKTDGTTLGPGAGLWSNGAVPDERRTILPDNATIEWGAQ